MEIVTRIDLDLVDQLDYQTRLFQGCSIEASRADTVAFQLDGLRFAIMEANNMHMNSLIDEIRACAFYCRELVDLSHVYQDRAPVVLNHLNVILPCLSRSLRDITTFYEDRTLNKKNRWRSMYHSMTNEADGLKLPERFELYNYFLRSLRDVVVRNPCFDLNGLEDARLRILQLRENRGIPPPPAQVGPKLRSTILAFDVDPDIHWAKQIFTVPLSSRTNLKNQHRSLSAGPHLLWGQIKTPERSKMLFRRSFNEDQISLQAYEDGRDLSPYLLLRVINPDTGGSWFSLRGFHELCIEREGSSLQLTRWSRSGNCPKIWAILNFMTWEELVLMFSTFLVLKARNDMTLGMAPLEYSPKGEKKLFQARIDDDGYTHQLIVYKDNMTGGIRLHAAVWEGELRQCPVWTAFVTHQSSCPTWIKRVGRRRIRLSDIQLYVFCQDYRQENQRRTLAGAFEINFHCEEACEGFTELFPLPKPLRSRTPDRLEAPR